MLCAMLELCVCCGTWLRPSAAHYSAPLLGSSAQPLSSICVHPPACPSQWNFLDLDFHPMVGWGGVGLGRVCLPAPASPGPAPSALTPNTPAPPPAPSTPPKQHTHINPYQIQQLNSSWVFTGSSYTSYFEARGRAAASAGAAGWGAGLAAASSLMALLPGSPGLSEAQQMSPRMAPNKNMNIGW
jgi:hypothetical protein